MFANLGRRPAGRGAGGGWLAHHCLSTYIRTFKVKPSENQGQRVPMASPAGAHGSCAWSLLWEGGLPLVGWGRALALAFSGPKCVRAWAFRWGGRKIIARCPGVRFYWVYMYGKIDGFYGVWH